ncbi:DUF2378 family protein [Aggregicoccus sp. 17bor-14]|uniref:DUF2378 family protein n=1 Tax=Myxococcaceae TaxID=31 RepID=UPI00129C7B8A|nr:MULTISPECIES: DUF2378 family protein [Myxococcaceae]MBF5043600.1 DUF2378 family protein [Simulacricoccus sp. 17bor-14]MRI89359.1 DUF2378 family protein [Aggregicoccus sp. 17bor-14]
MTTEQVLFSTAVESLYRQALKGRLSEVLKLRLRHAGLDLTRPLLPAYPRRVWVRSLELTAEELYPGLEREEALAHLGSAFIEGYAHTLVGGAVMSMSRLLGPGRTLARLTRSLRTSNNYSEARLTAHAANRYALWVNEPADTEGFMEGALRTSLRMAGAREPHVQRVRAGPEACEYVLSWALAEAA